MLMNLVNEPQTYVMLTFQDIMSYALAFAWYTAVLIVVINTVIHFIYSWLRVLYNHFKYEREKKKYNP